MNKISIFGVPSTAGCRAETSQGIDQDRGPVAIREALKSITKGFNISLPYSDQGDLRELTTVDSLLKQVEDCVNNSRTKQELPLLIGGAHTLTVGTLRALAKTDPDIALVYLDAHPDLMPRADINYGSTLYHALNEDILKADNIYLLGVRQIEQEEAQIIAEKNIFTASMDDFYLKNIVEIIEKIIQRIGSRPVLLSFDLDSIDPVFAPGVTTPYPLGLLPIQALAICRSICRETNVVAAELVELSPMFDTEDRTAKLAAAFLIELTQTLANKN